ncbi:MAG: IS21 family transposase [Acidimicrobiia bacterium]
MEAEALFKRGWTISAIARHLGRDRKTVRAYVSGERTPGVRRRSTPEVFEPFAGYVTQRLADDRHVWASTLFDEVVELGYAGSYPSFTRALRARALRPACPACTAGAHRESAIIAHPAGEETQFDWLELPDPPLGWGLSGPAHLLVGSLAHSSRWRAVLAESEDQAHLIEALDGVVRRLGGVSRYWRFDRMATVCHPGSGRVTASFAAVAKHYGAAVTVCPSRRGQRKGVVEKANHSAAQRWWRTLADEHTMVGAQADLDRFCARVGDARTRRRDDGSRVTVAELAVAEQLVAAPTTPYPAVMAVTRTVSAQALVAFRGNAYSVPPGMPGRELIVSSRLGSGLVEVATETGVVLARHHRTPDGAGAVVRDSGHVAALEAAVLAGFTDRVACRGKTRRPPSPAARVEAARLRGDPAPDAAAGDGQVLDFAAYAAAVRPITGPGTAGTAGTASTVEESL